MLQTNPQNHTNRAASPVTSQRNAGRSASAHPTQRNTNRSTSARPAQQNINRSSSARPSQRNINRSTAARPTQRTTDRTRIVRPMRRKPSWGIGSLSLLLLLLSALWSASFSGKCLGDTLLTKWNLPAWSPHSIGVHYTPFYALVLIIPAYILANLYPRHRGTATARLLSVLWMGALIIFAAFFVITEVSHS